MGLHQLLYVSKPSNVYHKDIEAILSKSRTRNASVGISGALIFTSDWFIQIIEGRSTAITNLYNRIAQDPRHVELELRLVRPIPERCFTNWGMDYVSQSQVSMAANRRFPVDMHFDPTDMSSETMIRFAATVSGSNAGEPKGM